MTYPWKMNTNKIKFLTCRTETLSSWGFLLSPVIWAVSLNLTYDHCDITHKTITTFLLEEFDAPCDQTVALCYDGIKVHL